MNRRDRNLAKKLETKIDSGLKLGRAIRAIFDLTLLSAAVLVFAFLDTPVRPYLIVTAIVMGVIIIAWYLLKAESEIDDRDVGE